jgi:serine/threonine-protein kinase
VTPERLKRASEVVQVTLRLNPEDRLAYLDTACGGDRELRHEVESILQAQSNETLRLAPKCVQRIGRYEIEGPLGSGAMGVVYLARDTALDRKVAIKSIFSASAESLTLQQRLLREAKAAGALSHPHIVSVHDVFDDQGSTYVVMEYVPGANVDATIRALAPGRTLPPETVLRIIRQTASALDYAHGQGVIHRDIKPANLLLDLNGSVKVVDFGIAKMANSDTDLTQGAPIGTVAYMSPEQLNSETLTGQADQFALAAMAYVLFTGQPMFPQAATVSALMFKNCFEQPVPVSRVKFGLPQALDEAVARGVAKKAADRFPTCTEFAAACERAFLGGAAPVPMPLATGPQPKQKTGVIVWTLMVLAGILVAVLMSMTRSGPAGAPSPPASSTSAPAPVTAPENIPPAATPEKKPVGNRSIAQNTGKETPDTAPVLIAKDFSARKQDATRPSAPVPAEPKVSAVPPKATIAKPAPYTGPDSGQFVWTGTLNAGDSVTVTASATEVSGAYLPGVAVQIEVVPAVVVVATAPSPANKFQTMVLKNSSGRAQNLIIVKWKVMQ